MTLRRILTAFTPLEAFGMGAIFCAAPMILEMVWEETILTWQSGPQMLGFTVAHAFPFLLLFGFLGVAGLALYLLLWLGSLLMDMVRKRPLQRSGLWVALAACLLLGLLVVPYECWMTVTTKTAGPGPLGVALLQKAVVEHHWPQAEALLKHGVSVDDSRKGTTVLNQSCARRDLVAARFLMAHGASLAKAPECQWMPELTGRPAIPQVPGTSIYVAP